MEGFSEVSPPRVLARYWYCCLSGAQIWKARCLLTKRGSDATFKSERELRQVHLTRYHTDI